MIKFSISIFLRFPSYLAKFQSNTNINGGAKFSEIKVQKTRVVMFEID